MFGPHFNIVFFWRGGGGSILSEPGFRGKHSKIKHTTCIFLNIFVQDCSLLEKNKSYVKILGEMQNERKKESKSGETLNSVKKAELEYM